MDENEKLFGLYATISRLSHHCFKLCDSNLQSAHLNDNSITCVCNCVESAMKTRTYVSERLYQEYPSSKHHNKSLEFTSSIDFT